MRLRSKFTAHQGGAAALEFAILVPVFLIMVTGMVAYGIYFGAAHSIQQIAADAARTAIGGLNANERNTLVAAYIANNAGSYPLIDTQRITYEIGDKPGDASQYLVTVHYDASDLPIWNLKIPLPLPGQTITFVSTIRRGGI